MTNTPSISYIFGAQVALTRTCRNSCRYCGFRDDTEQLLPLKELETFLDGLDAAMVTQVLLLTGDHPEEFPGIQLALQREDCHSFGACLLRAAELVLDHRMLPVFVAGTLPMHTMKPLAKLGAAMSIDMIAAPLQAPGEAHEFARNKSPQAGHEMVERAHEAGLPYRLNVLIGIGETEAERQRLIAETGSFCGADPYLQDVVITPFQPVRGTGFRGRPPLPFEAVANAVEAARNAFPVHHIAVPPHLFSRFPELIPFGLNDLGSITVRGLDVQMPTFPVPAVETLKHRLKQQNSCLYERLPWTTPAALKRPGLERTVEECVRRVERRHNVALNLIDNRECFVCVENNPHGLHLQFTTRDVNTCCAVWTAGPAYQGYAGVVHGGILSTLLDEAMATSVLNHGVKAVTADMKIRFLRPAPVGVPLQIIGTRVGSRHRIHFTRGSIILEDGTILAQGEGRFAEC